MEANLTPEEKSYFDNKGTVSLDKPADPVPEEPKQLDLEKAIEEKKEEAAPSVEAPAPQEEKKYTDTTLNKQIPLTVLLAEREKHKERERRHELELQQLKEKMDALTPQERQVDFKEDPATFLKNQNEMIMKKLELQEATQKERAFHESQEEKRATIVSFVDRSREEFVKDHPDYYDAYSHWKSNISDYMSTFTDDPTVINSAIEEQAQMIVDKALASHQNPSAVLYDAALKLKYKPQKAKTESLEKKKIENMQEAQKLTGLGGSQGTAPAPEQKLEDIVNMPMDKFMKEFDKNKWRKTMGGG